MLNCAFCYAVGYGSVDAFTIVDGYATCKDHFKHWKFAKIVDDLRPSSPAARRSPGDVPGAPAGASGA